MGVEKFQARGRSGFSAALFVALLPQTASALVPGAQGELLSGPAAGQMYSPGLALAPALAPAIGNVWMANPAWGSTLATPTYHSIADNEAFNDDPNSPSFDVGDYDPMWDDTKFSEISAYGGLARDALRVAGMRAIDGSDGASGAIPYGHLTLQRDFVDGRHQLTFGAYGTQVGVRQTAISDFGDDSYTDIAVDGTWRWTAHPERSNSDTITTHLMVLHEGESLLASHAIFGTNKSDNLVMFRGGASWSSGGNLVPAVQYFQISGTPDPIRLGTPDGIPDSKGMIAEVDYLPSDNVRSPLNWFRVKLSLQFIAYSEFDGSNIDASRNNTVLFHLSASTGPD